MCLNVDMANIQRMIFMQLGMFEAETDKYDFFNSGLHIFK